LVDRAAKIGGNIESKRIDGDDAVLTMAIVEPPLYEFQMFWHSFYDDSQIF